MTGGLAWFLSRRAQSRRGVQPGATIVYFKKTKEASNSGRQNIGIYVGDRESGHGTRIYVEKSGYGPGLRPKGASSTKKMA